MDVVSKLSDIYPESKNVILRVFSECRENRNISFSQVLGNMGMKISDESLDPARMLFLIFRYTMFNEHVYSVETMSVAYPKISNNKPRQIEKLANFVNMFILSLVEIPDTNIDFDKRLVLVARTFMFTEVGPIVNSPIVRETCLTELTRNYKIRDLDGFELFDF